MQDRKEILNELEGISSFVAKISAENLYEVPNEYFSKFAEAVLIRIKTGQADSVKGELEVLSPFMSRVNKHAPFNVPDDYFENFASTLINKIKSESTGSFSSELKEISPMLSSAEKQNPFIVPADYFERFASNLMSRVKAEESKSVDEELESLSPFLSKLNKKTPFSLPDNYFKELADNAMAGAKAVEFVNDELENLPLVLSELKNKNVYEIPAGYFENFSATVLNKIKTQQRAKVISINKKTNWLKYTAAAAVIGFIATTAVLIFNNKKPGTLYSYAKIDDKQLADSLHNANDEDILNYLQSHNVPVVDTSSSIAAADFNDDDVDDMLADVSDNELQQYANENNGTKESTTN